MAREPHAWFRKQTGWWMTTINHEKIKVVKGREKKAEANKKLREVLTLRDLNPAPESGELTVAVIDLYLTHAKGRVGERTLYEQKLILQDFAEARHLADLGRTPGPVLHVRPDPGYEPHPETRRPTRRLHNEGRNRLPRQPKAGAKLR